MERTFCHNTGQLRRSGCASSAAPSRYRTMKGAGSRDISLQVIALGVLIVLPRIGLAVSLDDCRISDSAGVRSIAARCGRVEVPENHADPGGDSIELFVAVVPALTRRPAESALTVIAGGPGAASSEFYVAYRSAFGRINRDRDILLVDQRGTGQSHRLDCPVPEEIGTRHWSVESARDSAAECLAGLSGDPGLYNTSAAVRDLDAVRLALGYPALDLYGASYGTRVAAHYLRRYPESTRSVILDGSLPPDEVLGPQIALDAQLALERIFERCASDSDCHGRFPDLAERFSTLRAALEQETIRVRMPDPTTGSPLTVDLGPLEVAAAIRILSYRPETMALIPLLIDAASHGNPAPLAAQAHMIVEDLGSALSYGMHNSVVCSEDVPHFAHLEIDRQALGATYLGTDQVDALEAVCEIWPAGPVDADLREPIRSMVPVLLISGEADPVTPPDNGSRFASDLPLARHLIVAGQGHGVAHVGCMPRLIAEFVDGTDLDALDASCLDKQGASPFFLDFSGPGP